MKSLLREILKMQSLPFYSKGVMSESDRKDQSKYCELERKLEANAKSLKKNDKVIFLYRKPSPSKKLFSPNPHPWEIIEGEVHVPVKSITRNTWIGDGYENVTTTTIKVRAQGYIYTLFPRDVEAI